MRKKLPKIAAWATAISAVALVVLAVMLVLAYIEYFQATDPQARIAVVGYRTDVSILLLIVILFHLVCHTAWKHLRKDTTPRRGR